MALEPLQLDISNSWPDPGSVAAFLRNVKLTIAELQTNNDKMVTLLTQLRQEALYGPLANPGFVISTNFDVKNGNAISYLNGGTLKTLSANTNFDTGTTATIATTKWNAAMLTVNSSGTAVLTWANAAGAASYASEALAIAALAAPAATDTVLGYVTVQAAGVTWTPGTDALTTGTGGTAATTTNYYNHVNPNALMITGTLPATTAQTGITLARG